MIVQIQYQSALSIQKLLKVMVVLVRNLEFVSLVNFVHLKVNAELLFHVMILLKTKALI